MFTTSQRSTTEENSSETAIIPVGTLKRTLNEDAEKKKDAGKLQDWVKLNVGGKYFTTSRSTLVSKEPTSMLARLVQSRIKLASIKSVQKD